MSNNNEVRINGSMRRPITVKIGANDFYDVVGIKGVYPRDSNGNVDVEKGSVIVSIKNKNNEIIKMSAEALSDNAGFLGAGDEVAFLSSVEDIEKLARKQYGQDRADQPRPTQPQPPTPSNPNQPSAPSPKPTESGNDTQRPAMNDDPINTDDAPQQPPAKRPGMVDNPNDLPKPKQKNCDCPECFEKYKSAFEDIIGNMTKILQNKVVGLPICPQAKAVPEPGCLKAYYSLKKGRNQLGGAIDAASVQPSTQIATNPALSGVDEEEKKLINKFLADIGISAPLDSTGKPIVYTNKDDGDNYVFFGPKANPVRPDTSLSGLTTNGGRPFRIQVLDKTTNRLQTVERPGGCKELLRLIDLDADFKAIADNVSNSPNAQWRAKRSQIVLHCCRQAIREMLDKGLENVETGSGSRSLFSWSFGVDAGLGGSSNPCSEVGVPPPGTLTLSEPLTCCLGNVKLCPDIECCVPPDDPNCIDKLVQDVDNAIAGLRQISNSGEPTCVNKLKTAIEQMLYGVGQQDGLFYKLIRAFLIHILVTSPPQSLKDAKGNLNPGDTGCGQDFAGALGARAGANGVKPGPSFNDLSANDKTAELYQDDVIYNTDNARVDAHRNTAQQQVCKYDLAAVFRISSIEIDNQPLITVYDNIINEMKKQLRIQLTELISDIFESVDIELNLPEVDKKECDKIIAQINELERDQNIKDQAIANSQETIQELQQEIAENDRERSAAKTRTRGTRQETRRIPGEAPDEEPMIVFVDVPKDTLPNKTGNESAACLRAREEYFDAKSYYEFSLDEYNKALQQLTESRLEKNRIDSIFDVIKGYERVLTGKLDSEDIEVREWRYVTTEKYWEGNDYISPRTAGALRERISAAKTQWKRKLDKLQQDIEGLDKDTTGPIGAHWLTVLKRKRELADAGEKVKKTCGYDTDVFNPITPEECDTIGPEDTGFYDRREESLNQLIEILNELIKEVRDEKVSNQSEISKLEQLKEIYCGGDTGSATTISTCFLSCFINKVDDTVDKLVSVDLTKALNAVNDKEFKCDGDKKNPAFEEPGTDVFDNTITTTKVTEAITKLVEECLIAEPGEGGTGCEDLNPESKKADFDEEVARRTKDANAARKAMEALTARSPSGYEVGGVKLAQKITGAIDTDVINDNYLPSATANFIRERVELDFTHGGFKSTDDIIDTMTIRYIRAASAYARAKRKLVQMVRYIDRQNELYNNCLELSKSWDCATVLNTKLKDSNTSVADRIRDELDAGLKEAYESILAKIAEFVKDAQVQGGGDGPAKTLGDLKSKLMQLLREKISKACPPSTGDGALRFETPQPTTPQKDGLADISEKDVSIICVGQEPTHILVNYRVYRTKFFQKDTSFMAFGTYITGILNNTILCDKKSTSVFHNTIYRAFEDKIPDSLDSDQPTTTGEGLAGLGGPAFIPDGNEGGPYHYPPPNGQQIATKDLDQPCPAFCGHEPRQHGPNVRISILRRIYYEGKALLEYLNNLENVVDASVSALESIRAALEICALGKDPKTSPNWDNFGSSLGKVNPKNPALQKPTTADMAIIKAVLSKSEKFDAITGKGRNVDNQCDGCTDLPLNADAAPQNP